MLPAVIALTAILMMSSRAEAAWVRAETDKFIVVGDVGERSIRAFATKLDTYDRLLRMFHPTTAKRTPATKVQVVLLKNPSDLRRILPGLPPRAAGVYRASNEGVFALALYGADYGDWVLFHEYAHHFMLENFPVAYPAWFVEGWAEYFGATQIDGSTIKVGVANQGRVYSILSRPWIPLEDLLSKSTDEIRKEQRTEYYAQAWLLTHYMRSDNARAQQLSKAIDDIADGKEPIKAFEAATGVSLAETTKALKAYDRIRIITLKTQDMAPPAMTVTSLPESAEDLFIPNLRLILASTGRVDAPLLADVRAKAARYPGDMFAEMALARAEFVMGDVAAGEAIMARRLAANPEDKETLLLAGTGRVMAGIRDEPNRAARYREARPLLAKAYQKDERDFRALYAYAWSRSYEPSFPTDNDVNVLLKARDLAPSVTELSYRAGMALMKRERRNEAGVLLRRIINDPHGGRAAEQARRALAGSLSAEAGLAADASDGNDVVPEPTPSQTPPPTSSGPRPPEPPRP